MKDRKEDCLYRADGGLVFFSCLRRAKRGFVSTLYLLVEECKCRIIRVFRGDRELNKYKIGAMGNRRTVENVQLFFGLCKSYRLAQVGTSP